MTDLAKNIQNLYEVAKRHRKEIDKNWGRWFNFYIGKQHKDLIPSTKKDIALNYCFSTIETIVPIMTDNRPRLYVVPQERTDEQAARLADAVLEWLWSNVLHMDIKLPQIIRSALIWGTSFLKVYWDSYKNEIGISVLDPHEIFVDPEAIDFDEARYVIHAVIRDIAYIRRAYPEHGYEVQPDTNYSSLRDEERLETTGDWKADIGKKALVLECWLREPDELEEYVEETPEGPVTKKQPKYPQGRVITVANNIVLRDIPNPYEDFPFIKFEDYQVPNRFWGQGEIEQIVLLQQEINKRKAQIMKNADLIANPPLIVPRDSGVDADNLTNEPGMILEPNTMESRPIWMDAKELPSFVFNLLERSKFELDSITGVHDVTQGRRPTGITAGVAIAELQEAAQTRIRLKVRIMEAALCRAGFKILQRVKDNYDELHYLRIIGEDGRPQIVEFTGKDINFDFKIQVEAGSSMPVNRYTRFQQALLLYNAKAIDAQALLEAANWPDREKVLARMQVPPIQIAPSAGPGVSQPAMGMPPETAMVSPTGIPIMGGM